MDHSMMPDMAVCIRVPKAEGESVRSGLISAGILDTRFRISSDGDYLYIPITADSYMDYPAVVTEQEERERRIRDYREAADVPDGLRELLPSSFDVVGDIAMIKIPPELLPYKEQIGNAMLLAGRNLRSVFSDSGVKGEFRIRDLERIAGTGPSETVHREFGTRLYTDPARVYFNPRLSSERARIASEVKKGEIIIDMFGGVAPFGTVICRLSEPAAVYSVDLNPEAERYARMNAERNGIKVLKPITGDSSKVIYTLPDADRIIMNLPQAAERFLRYALDKLKPEGKIHMYKILERSALESFCDDLASEMESLGFSIGIKCSELKTYSPTMSVYSMDITHSG